MRLHSYYRSSAAYRVRIALNLKGLKVEQKTWHLGRGEHLEGAYADQATFRLLPILEDGPVRLQQTMAIIEYLEELWPTPPLLPRDPAERARARSLASLVACEVHPLNNLRVLKQLRLQFDANEAQIQSWYVHWCVEGLSALQRELAKGPATLFAVGQLPTLADCFIVPQLFNARRFKVDTSAFPRLEAIDRACATLDAFQRAHPAEQPDAEA